MCKKIREKNGWRTSEQLLKIDDLNKVLGNDSLPESLEEALRICKKYWAEFCNAERVSQEKSKYARTIRKNLFGEICLGSSDRSFCFINVGQESFFCSKKDLPDGIKEGDKVNFDGIPSFDRKKQKDSWKAINVSL